MKLIFETNIPRTPTELFFVSTESRSILDRHLDRIIVAGVRIELVGEKVQPAHSTPYLSGPKSREFENIEKKDLVPEDSRNPTDRMGIINCFYNKK